MVLDQSASTVSRLLTLIAFALAIAGLYLAQQVLLPLALAILLSFVLTPPVRFLERLRVPRVLAVLAVVLVAFVPIGLLGWAVTDQVIEFADNLPDYRENLVGKVRSLGGRVHAQLGRAEETIKDIGRELADGGQSADGERDRAPPAPGADQTAANPSEEEDAVPVRVIELATSPMSRFGAWLGPLLYPLSTAGIVIVLVVFILAKREDLRDRVIQLAGTGHLHATTELLRDAQQRVSRYLRMQLLINTCYGTALGLGLWVIGLPNPLLWGGMGVMVRFLPYAGPIISSGIPILLSLAVFDGWTLPLATIGLIVVLELIVNNVLEPLLYGSTTGVSSLGILVAAIFWTWLWGPVGLVLAVPLTVCLVTASRFVPQLRFLAVLLGDSSVLSIEERIYQRLLALDYDEASQIARSQLRILAPDEVADRVLVPVLRLAETDRRAGRLDSEEAAATFDAIDELIDELSPELTAATEATEQSATSPPTHQRQARLLCLSAGNQTDQLSAELLRRLLPRTVQCEVIWRQAVSGEAIEQIDQGAYDLLLISVLPAESLRRARYLAKRLRGRFPELPVVLGLWTGQPATNLRQQLAGIGKVDLATSMSDAVATIRRIAGHIVLQTPHAAGDVNDEPLSKFVGTAD